jgi:hypothetical protein
MPNRIQLLASAVLVFLIVSALIPLQYVDSLDGNEYYSESNNYPPSFGLSSVYIGDGSVHLLANNTVVIWDTGNLSLYDLNQINSTGVTYPCEAVSDRQGDKSLHPISVSRDRNYITCANNMYHLNGNNTLDLFLSDNFYSDQFGPFPISIVSSNPSGCGNSGQSLHQIISNNTTIHTISYCISPWGPNYNFLRSIVLKMNLSDFALITHARENCNNCQPANYYGYNNSGDIRTCDDGPGAENNIYSVNEGIMSVIIEDPVGEWGLCTILPAGKNVQHLYSGLDEPIDFRAHENCQVAVTSTLLISGEFQESIAGAKSVDCLTPDKVVINRNGYLEYWWMDQDGDGVNDLDDAFPLDNSQQFDSDGDGFGDNGIGNNPDSCPFTPGDSFADTLGCPDDDQDGWSNSRDKFAYDSSQWNDTDSDGFGDNLSGFQGDYCPSTFGRSDQNGTYGCFDYDGDGWADIDDRFVNISSQWADSDNDGYGDEFTGYEPDACPIEFGTSSGDRYGCLDTDGDSWSDEGDALPFNPSQWIDRDGDGYGDNNSEGAIEIDLFPNEVTQWNDTDGDGYGDNPLGSEGDQFPLDDTEWRNTDGDELGDNSDAFPFDPTQTVDSDGDGMGDNPMGIGADKFPNDPTQWGDIDGDGYGDNATGNNSDAFITDPTQWADADGDGYGDSPIGRLPDLFPNDPTQWEDADGDGLGDNLTGTDADPYLNDFDNDGYNDSVDPLPKLASPGDLDNDGCLDADDVFPSDYKECLDSDGDGEGDNADTDDDNDGWADTDEMRRGTDPFSSAETPVDSFEMVVPGTAIGLGAWDLIGIFGGVPLFSWLAFGFATRNARCGRFEEKLNATTNLSELEAVALQWEYSLMMRLLGPHQGIRLERLRADLEDGFAAQEVAAIPMGFDQTAYVMTEDTAECP